MVTSGGKSYRMIRPASTTLGIVGLAVFAACLKFDPYKCTNNLQCVLEDQPGHCQPTGYCSYPDLTCPTGFRYEEHAPEFGGECVEPVTPMTSSSTNPMNTEDDGDESTTEEDPDTTDPDTTNPTTDPDTGETGDNCGAAGQACCDGETCDAGLGCYADQCSCVQAIDAGDNHTCALLVDGSVQCWGANEVGQLGDFVGASSLSPTNASAMLAPGMEAIAIDARRQTCAVRADQSTVCWGDNASGQAAPLDPTTIIEATQATFVLSATLPAVGGSHTCIARDDTNLMTCFGDNAFGQLTTGAAPGPIDSMALFAFAEIELGQDFGCGRTATGDVYCWGNNASGQLAASPGAVPTSDTLRNVVLMAGNAADIAVGANHACARVGAQVFCWGANDVGQLGDGLGTQSETPVQVMLPAGAIAHLESGPNHTCAIMGAGDLNCWGSNSGDQLLNETVITDFSLVPVVADIGDGVFLDDVEGGLEHACILTTTHEVLCWGPNTLGQAGIGMAGYVFEPTPIDLMCP